MIKLLFLPYGSYTSLSSHPFCSLSYSLSFPRHVFQSFIHSCSSSVWWAFKLLCCVYVFGLSRKLDHFWSFFSKSYQSLFDFFFFHDAAQDQGLQYSASARHTESWFFSDSHIWDCLVFLLHLNYALAVLYYSSFTIKMSCGTNSEISFKSILYLSQPNF